ncbi:MAG: hypothetical protein ACRDS1_15970 [Pseudonocardiaceae bacterium]
MTRYVCPQAETCPGCGATTGVQPKLAPPKVQAWSCTACETQWAITVVNPRPYLDHLAGMVAARSVLRQVIALADQAPELTDEELRTQLHALAASCGAR